MIGRIYDEDPERGGEAEAALEEMEDAEEEEAEMEEVEDLLEYYLQRAATTQTEAQRLLDGARDLEESISVSLSARRFEVRALSNHAPAHTEMGIFLAICVALTARGFAGTVCMHVSISPAVCFVRQVLALFPYSKLVAGFPANCTCEFLLTAATSMDTSSP